MFLCLKSFPGSTCGLLRHLKGEGDCATSDRPRIVDAKLAGRAIGQGGWPRPGRASYQSRGPPCDSSPRKLVRCRSNHSALRPSASKEMCWALGPPFGLAVTLINVHQLGWVETGKAVFIFSEIILSPTFARVRSRWYNPHNSHARKVAYPSRRYNRKFLFLMLCRV